MEIIIETSNYNERRYSKPWIAKIDFSSDPIGNFTWGKWVGDHNNGGDGILTISANPGDIIAEGQKDFRKPKNSASTYYLIEEDGKLRCLGDKGSAYKYYLSQKDKDLDKSALRKEREMLLARIAEINNLLGEKL